MQRSRRTGRSLSTLVDVARRAGVSTATVSRAMNGTGQVSAATSARIAAAVRDLDYSPNSFAQALASQRSRTFGAVVPSLANSIFSPGIEAIQRRLESLGLSLLVACSDYDLDKELAQVRTLVTRGVDGLILVGRKHHPELRPLLATRRVPYVCQGAYEPDGPHPCVGFDNRKAMARVVDRLVALGHRRFACIAGIVADNDRVADRVAAVQATLAGHGLALPRDGLVECRYDLAQARAATRRLLALEPRPTAIVCINDVLASGALFECLAQGVRVPADLSIFGFDDFDFAQHLHPSLSTVRIPTQEMGERAVDNLLARIDGRAVPHAEEVDSALILRESAGPAPMAPS